MLLDLSGFTSLSQFWNQSWGKMAAVAFWSWLVLRCIGEWRAEAAGGGRAEPAPEKASPFRWMLPQLSYLLWGAATLLAVVFALSDMDVVASLVRTVYGFSFSIGSIRLSVHGVFFSLVILFVTYLFTRTARHVLNDKVLDHRTLERGLKDSIVTVSSYLIWALGIVLALSVLGVNTTSLAVVFGALSIGIGFGLQNIFNNFISGLILLFERPIQVGDYVEVNGVWAEVKKINVRATVVQTFDNASLIIPNSDFISQQVTNWSFKDPRMRRHVDIGVAYGSDVERVRATLLEIADAVSGVLKYPHPDVIFLDHGDSALVFRLRYWTHVDNYFSTSTAIRFAIDRRFRELGIEIPFPQRDLHIRTVPQEAPPAKGAHTPGEAEAATVGGAGADAHAERDV
jgi:small-conductance mechanosensitive channel